VVDVRNGDGMHRYDTGRVGLPVLARVTQGVSHTVSQNVYLSWQSVAAVDTNPPPPTYPSKTPIPRRETGVFRCLVNCAQGRN
jgi:hypothetical protein